MKIERTNTEDPHDSVPKVPLQRPGGFPNGFILEHQPGTGGNSGGNFGGRSIRQPRRRETPRLTAEQLTEEQLYEQAMKKAQEAHFQKIASFEKELREKLTREKALMTDDELSKFGEYCIREQSEDTFNNKDRCEFANLKKKYEKLDTAIAKWLQGKERTVNKDDYHRACMAAQAPLQPVTASVCAPPTKG
jgi:hypothetical protein